MYATSVMSITGELCIGVDIIGGNLVKKWKATAWAYFSNPRKGENECVFEKSCMYTVRGVPGLVAIAAGLVAAHAKAENTDISLGKVKRLGPVVDCHGDALYKV
mmetsp:Transcript_11718/g.17900  ORF Transcript_11718/g.17900 Transcript_11718/m.17900 type:complete len:104 (+) Transcript_11718:169-480(+)